MHIARFLLFWYWTYFAYIIQGYFIGTGAIIRLPSKETLHNMGIVHKSLETSEN